MCMGGYGLSDCYHEIARQSLQLAASLKIELLSDVTRAETEATVVIRTWVWAMA